MGRVEKYKGHLDLITALGTLPKIYLKKVHLVVVGSGEEMEINTLQDFAEAYGVSKNVHFLGYLDQPSSCLIEQFDLCAMVTRSFEGFGLTVIEAMQVGTPVLATDVGAVLEFLDGKSGKIIPPSAPGAIAMAMKELVDNPEGFIKRAKYAKSKAPKNAKEMAKSYWLLMNAACLALKR
jgi:glycosyltransferase involved in cell wall biosynthesis